MAPVTQQLRPVHAPLRAAAPRTVPSSAGRRGVVVRAEESMSEAYARIRAARAASKRKYERQEAAERGGPVGKFLAGVVSALDFQEDVASDRSTLASFRNLRTGQKLSNQQEGALKRKIVGTKAGFFGESVDLKGKYADAGYVSSKREEVPYLWFLVAVVLGVCAATVVVVSKAGA